MGQFYGIDTQGRLRRWYHSHGSGAFDLGGRRDWDLNSGNAIGNGWQAERHVIGCGDGVDPVGACQRRSRSGACMRATASRMCRGRDGLAPEFGQYHRQWLGRYAQPFREPAGKAGRRAGSRCSESPKMAISAGGRYDGDGAADPSGATGWHPNSGATPSVDGWASFEVLVATAAVISGALDDRGLFRAGTVMTAMASTILRAPRAGTPIGATPSATAWKGLRAHPFAGSRHPAGVRPKSSMQ